MSNWGGASGGRYDARVRYVMQQKFWSLGNDFTIRDADGHDVLLVDGRAFAFGEQLSIRDMGGH